MCTLEGMSSVPSSLAPETFLGWVSLLAWPLLRTVRKDVSNASSERQQNRLCVTRHITWFLPLKPKVLLTYSAGEGTEVEADVLISVSETKDLNEASDTWH